MPVRVLVLEARAFKDVSVIRASHQLLRKARKMVKCDSALVDYLCFLWTIGDGFSNQIHHLSRGFGKAYAYLLRECVIKPQLTKCTFYLLDALRRNATLRCTRDADRQPHIIRDAELCQNLRVEVHPFL